MTSEKQDPREAVGPIRRVGDRGIGIYMEEIRDLNGTKIKVSQSSLATEDAVRIYVGDQCAHLGFEHAYCVREGLNRWLLEYFPREVAHLDGADAADPLRAILPEVVGRLEGLRHGTGGFVAGSWESRLHADICDIEARLREFNPTNGGTEDGGG